MFGPYLARQLPPQGMWLRVKSNDDVTERAIDHRLRAVLDWDLRPKKSVRRSFPRAVT
jgi:hypothetical protein